MDSLSLKQAVIRKYDIEENEYETFVLNRTLFFRVRVVRPFVSLFNKNFLFNEKRLIQQLGNTTGLREVHEEIDFYQHKYVAGFMMKEALRFRTSGMKVIHLAKEVFHTRKPYQ